MKDSQKSGNKVLRKWLFPLFTLVLILLVLQFYYSRRQNDFNELIPEEGILDVREISFTEEIYNVANHWDYYPFHLYTSEDFAREIPEKAVRAGRDISTDEVPFGTYRLRLKSTPGQILTLCSFSLDYGTTVYVNGTEVVRFGQVAEDPDQAVPGGGFMTVPVFFNEQGEAEIIYQYSNFVHKEGGAIPPTYLSTPQNMEEYKNGNALVSVGLSGAMLLLSLYFLLFASIQHQSGYLALAFCCLLMALRDNLFWGSYLLPAEASWQFTYRTSLSVVALLPFSFLMLFNSLYPAEKKTGLKIYITAVMVNLVFLVFLDSIYCTFFCRISYWLSGIYLVYYLVTLFQKYRKKKAELRMPDILTLCGLGVFLMALLWEAFFSGRNSFITRFGLTPTAMILCIFLIAVSISLRIQQQKEALVQSRSRAEMLERMNALNLDFFRKVAHELKSPLTVISGYAQLTGYQLSGNQTNEETPENLKIIHQEAMRLAELVNQLMDYSRGIQRETVMSSVSVKSLLKGIQAVCTPMCMKNENRIVICNETDSDVYGNEEVLLQVFINLIVNANRHTRQGRIRITASEAQEGDAVIFRVQDNGEGIAEQAIEHLFDKGFSNDGSSGIGLSLCKEAMEAHGGSIRLEKTGPEGTTFAVTVLKRRQGS